MTLTIQKYTTPSTIIT